MPYEEATCAHCARAIYRVIGRDTFYHRDTRNQFCATLDPTVGRSDYTRATPRLSANGG